MLGNLLTIASEELRYNLVTWKHQLGNGRSSQMPITLVNGSPKSGTTWMLKMIGSVPGHRGVGNFNGDIQRYHSVVPGNVIHGHDWYTDELNEILTQNRVKVVLMIRDPRDQLVSRMFHVKRSEKHPLHAELKDMDNDELLMACIDGRGDGLPGTSTMVKLAQSWLESDADFYCVRYEALLADSVAHFSNTLSYIGIADNRALAEVIVARNRFERLSAGKRIWQTRKPGQENVNSHFRKGISGDWRNHLKPTHIARFKEVAGQQLIDLGYEKDFAW